MNGSMVKNHISFKTGFGYLATRRTSFLLWFLVYLQLLQARLLQHPQLFQIRKLIIHITIQQSSQVKVWIDKYGETRILKHRKSCHMNQPKSPNQTKMRITNRYGETRIIPTYRNGCKNSERILWMKEFLNTENHREFFS